MIDLKKLLILFWIIRKFVESLTTNAFQLI